MIRGAVNPLTSLETAGRLEMFAALCYCCKFQENYRLEMTAAVCLPGFKETALWKCLQRFVTFSSFKETAD